MINDETHQVFASVIVPCRNEVRYLEPFLDTLGAQESHFHFEVIIADGMSDDGSRELLVKYAEKDPRVRVIDNPERTTPKALNLAIMAAKGDYILRMDVHTEYASDYIQKCIEISLAKPEVRNVGGPARTRSRNYMQAANCLAYHSPISVGGAAFHNQSFEGYVDTVPYGCWGREYLIGLGMFDESFVRNQDDELNLRIIRSGGKIWQSPDIVSWYYPRDNLRGLFNQYRQYGYWKVRVIQKHRIPASIRHLIPGLFVSSLVFFLLTSFWLQIAGYLLALELSLYGSVLIVGSLHACFKPHNRKYIPAMPFVIAAYHFGYGIGFLMGMFDFFVLRKQPNSDRFGKLTR